MIERRLRWRGGLALLLGASLLGAAEFSRTLTPAEFAAAGLGKLTPAELAQLDALVRDRTDDGSPRAPGTGPTAVPPAPAAAEPARNWRERMRVVLMPGTEITYTTVESQLQGSFRGYEPGRILTLANGQRWRVLEGKYWAPAKTADQPRKVIVRPGALGSFFLEIEGGGRPKVSYVDTVREKDR